MEGKVIIKKARFILFVISSTIITSGGGPRKAGALTVGQKDLNVNSKLSSN